MKHSDFLLLMACLITLCFIVVVIALFILLYVLIGNVWVALLLTFTISALAIPIIFKAVGHIKYPHQYDKRRT